MLRDDRIPPARDDGFKTRGSPTVPEEDDQHQDAEATGSSVEADERRTWGGHCGRETAVEAHQN